jgi:hypothetical protein
VLCPLDYRAEIVRPNPDLARPPDSIVLRQKVIGWLGRLMAARPQGH